MRERGNILILNHFFWPDNHGAARYISEFASELVMRGWNVKALVGNRSYHDPKQVIKPRRGIWSGVEYKRIWLPPLNQKRSIPRLFISIWILLSWTLNIPFERKCDIIILSTNPPFGYFIIPFLKVFKRRTKMILWGFDLYPEAIIAEGGILNETLAKVIYPFTLLCHRLLDVIVDIGPCMKEKYDVYKTSSKRLTLTPWSFVEPSSISEPNAKIRKQLFGNAQIGLLYSGTMGFAHEFDNFLRLARYLRDRSDQISFCFAGFGNRFEELRDKVTQDDTNIYFGSFVMTDKELEDRLLSSDILMISLKETWTGIAVPSKFFGAIAAGRAVMFSGSEKSSISKWIKDFGLGFNLTSDNIAIVASVLLEIQNETQRIDGYKKNAQFAYKANFSKKIICDKWHELLTEVMKTKNKA